MSVTGHILIRAGLDQNPMRRRVDRVESWTSIALSLMFLILTPTLTWYAGQITYRSGVHSEQVQHRDRHLVTARLIAPGSSRLESGSAFLVVSTMGQWTAPDGTVRTGTINISPSSTTVTSVPIWTDSAGNLTTKPQRHRETLANTSLAVVLSLTILAGLAVGIHALLRSLLDHKRFAQWQCEWTTVGPQWSRPN